MQRYALRATWANGIGSTGRSRDQRPLAGSGIHDLEIEVRENHGAVPHHDNRFLWPGAEDGIPRATAEPASHIDDQASPPFCWRSLRLPYAHRASTEP